MKAKFIFWSIAVAAALTSCAKEIKQAEELTPGEAAEYSIHKVFSASNEPGTKTTLDYESKKVSWEKDDEIKILWAADGSNTAKASQAGATADFDTSVDDAAAYYAVYPSAVTSSLSGEGVLSVTVPSEQGGSFANANIAVAKADDDDNFSFKHLVGIIRLQTSLSDAKSIEIKGASDDVLTGTVKVSSFGTDGLPVYTVENGASAITLEAAGEGVYYAAILPSASLKCLSVKITTKTGEEEVSQYALSANGLSMERAKVVNLGNIDGRLNKHFFVKEGASGTGDGRTWETALSYQQMVDEYVAANRKGESGVKESNEDITTSTFSDEYREKHNTVHAAQVDGATFHIAGGTYTTKQYVRISFPERGDAVTMNFVGGYDPASTGTDLSKRDTTAFHTILDGANARRHFFVRYYSDVTFDGIIFKNGKATPAGSILFHEAATSSLTFKGCEFIENATTTNGGVLSENAGGKLTFTDCKFKRNSADTYGGAIYLSNVSTALFENCSFNSNKATNNGGALWLSKPNVTLTNCTLSGNETNQVGGAILATSTTTLTVNGTSSFTGNTSPLRGGAIYCSGTGTYTISGTTFDGNNNKTSTHDDGGGAILATSTSTWNLTGCTFSNNNGNKAGGAISATGASTWTINKTEFEDNQATDGGAISATAASTWTINNTSVFKGNHVSGNGGAISATGTSTWTIDNTEFEKNYAKTGGAILFNKASEWTIRNNSSFTGNYTTNGWGGAIYAHTGTLTVSGSSLTGNYTTTNGGGAIYITTNATLNLSSSTLSGNTSAADGSAIAIADTAPGTHKIQTCLFKGNKTGTWGGAISARRADGKTTPTVYIDGCVLEGNIGSSSGANGQLYSQVNTYIHNCSIYNNGSTNTNCSLSLNNVSTHVLMNSTVYEQKSGISAMINYNASHSANDFNNVLLSANTTYYAWKVGNNTTTDISITSKGYNYYSGYATYGSAATFTPAATDNNVAWADVKDNFTLTDNADGKNWYTWTVPSGMGLATKTEADTFLDGVTGGAEFKAWLTANGSYGNDIAGTPRGDSGWYPGCYQPK